MPTFADRGVSRGQRNGSPRPYSRISRPEPLLFLPLAPQLYSRGWVDPVRDPLLLRKSGSAGNRTRDLWICSQELWPHTKTRILLKFMNAGCRSTPSQARKEAALWPGARSVGYLCWWRAWSVLKHKPPYQHNLYGRYGLCSLTRRSLRFFLRMTMQIFKS
jgi:hypothetical protein